MKDEGEKTFIKTEKFVTNIWTKAKSHNFAKDLFGTGNRMGIAVEQLDW